VFQIAFAADFDGFPGSAREGAYVLRLTPRPRPKSLFESNQSPLVSLLTSLVTLVISYFVSVSLYLVVVKISDIPQGDVWNDGFKVAFQFVFIMIIVLGLLVPAFQKEFDPGLRTFSIFSAAMLVAYTVFRVAGLDPDQPLRYLATHVADPIIHWASTLHP
jgi:uncharacterized membrane protein